MPHDYGAPPEAPLQPPPVPWWRLLRPRHVLGAALGLAGLGFLIGYLITVFIVFPSQDVAANLRQVPDLVGTTAEEARRALDAAGLAFEEESDLYHSAAVGTVVAQEPLAGQMAQPGSPVKVILSLGPKLAPVPDVVGLGHEQAEIALASAGYESEFVWVDAETDVGEVIDTRPAPGTPVQLPGRVQLIVSAGPPEMQVPNLVTRSLAEARETLERIGLRLGTIRQDSASLAAPGTVLAQSPRAGTVVERATRITVTVAIAAVSEEPRDSVSRER